MQQEEVTSRRQAVVSLTFQVEQLLKQASSQLTTEQTSNLETLTDQLRHRLSTVSITIIHSNICAAVPEVISKTRCQNLQILCA